MVFMKPFKTPTVVARTPSNRSNSSQPLPKSDEPPGKRRRISYSHEDGNEEVVAAAAAVLKKPKPVAKFQPLSQKSVNVSEVANQDSDGKSSGGQEGYYAVLWYVLLSLVANLY